MVTVSTEVAGTPKSRPRVGSATLTIVASRMAMNITPTYTALTAIRGPIRPPRPALSCPGTRSMQSRRPVPAGRHRAAGRPGRAQASHPTPAPDLAPVAGGPYRGLDHELRPNGGGLMTEQDFLTVTDSRTGQEYTIPITDGTIRATDLRQIRVSESGHGLISYDPGLINTAVARSSVTFLDGEAGVLEYRGYPIEQLAANASFLEVAYLLIYGHLPSEGELAGWVEDISMHTFVHENIKDFMQGFRYNAHPMGMLLASVGALSTFYADANVWDNPGSTDLHI